jgi:hypothetical protein
MIVGKENILKYIRDSNTPYWKIRRAGTTDIIAESDDSSSLSVEDSLVRFQNYLDLLSSGNYFLETWETAGQKKERLKVAFQLTGNAPAMSGANPPVNFPTIPAIDVQAEIQRALAEERQKNRIETLEKEKAALEAKCRELETELNSFGHRVFNRIEGVLGPVLNEFYPKTNLIGTAKSIEEIKNEQEEFEHIIEEFCTLDPEPLLVLKQLVKLRKNEPSTYQMARNILMSK